MTQPPAPGGGVRRTGRLRGSVDAMAPRAAEAPGADPASPGPAASAPGATTNTAAGTSSRRTRFAPAVPGERRARPKPAEEAAAEPQLPQSLRTLVRQAHTEAKATRGTREPVRGLESTASRGTGRARNDARTLAARPTRGRRRRLLGEKVESVEPRARTRRGGGGSRGSRDPRSRGRGRGRGGFATDARDGSSETRTPTRAQARAAASAPGEGAPPAAAPDAFAPASASASAPSSSLLHAAVGASPRERVRGFDRRRAHYPTALRDDREEARSSRRPNPRPSPTAWTRRPTRGPSSRAAPRRAAPARRGTGTGIGAATEGTATDPRGRVGGDESDAPAAAADAPVDGDRAERDALRALGTCAPRRRARRPRGRLGGARDRETVLDVLPGTTFAHDEQLAAIRVDTNRKKEKGTQSRDADGAERAEGECAFLGRVPGRLVCVPNVDSLLRASGEST